MIYRRFVWEKVAGGQAQILHFNATDIKLGSSTYFFSALFISGTHKVPGLKFKGGLRVWFSSCFSLKSGMVFVFLVWNRV